MFLNMFFSGGGLQHYVKTTDKFNQTRKARQFKMAAINRRINTLTAAKAISLQVTVALYLIDQINKVMSEQ